MNINTREIINRIPPLLETIEEGIDASITMLENLKLEESVSMLSDVYLGVQAVQHAFEGIEEVPEKKIKSSSKNFKTFEKNIAEYYSVYNNEVQGQLDLILMQKIIPDYKKWVKIRRGQICS
jgi:hypothetical protein